MILPAGFFNRDTSKVAGELIGKFLVCRSNGKKTARIITEVEAYDGFRDRASHAFHGRTVRTEPMFGSAGFWFVYFTYGIHWMLNAVTRGKNYPAAVLIRGVENINGPARVTKFLGIDKSFNARPISRGTGLWIEDRGVIIPSKEIIRSAGVGVGYAGEYWAKRKWRFSLK